MTPTEPTTVWLTRHRARPGKDAHLRTGEREWTYGVETFNRPVSPQEVAAEVLAGWMYDPASHEVEVALVIHKDVWIGFDFTPSALVERDAS